MFRRAFFLAVLTFPFIAVHPPICAQPPKNLEPRLVTLRETTMPLSKALAAIKEQTGIEVLRPADWDPSLSLQLDKTPFWQAIDQIAEKADLRVGVQQDGKINLTRGFRKVPVSYSGPFRISLTRLVTMRDLENDSHQCKAYLHVAWEPRTQVYRLETQPQDLVVQSDKGAAPAPVKGTKDRILADETAPFIEVPIMLPVQRRPATTYKQIKGSLVVTCSGDMLEFSFDRIQKGEAARKENVSVKLDDDNGVRTTTSLWQIKMIVEYPAGPAFDTHEIMGWVGKNKVYLESKLDGRRFGDSGWSVESQSPSRAVIVYRFAEKHPALQNKTQPADWKLIHRAPSVFREVSVPFEFRDVPTP